MRASWDGRAAVRQLLSAKEWGQRNPVSEDDVFYSFAPIPLPVTAASWYGGSD